MPALGPNNAVFTAPYSLASPGYVGFIFFMCPFLSLGSPLLGPRHRETSVCGRRWPLFLLRLFVDRSCPRDEWAVISRCRQWEREHRRWTNCPKAKPARRLPWRYFNCVYEGTSEMFFFTRFKTQTQRLTFTLLLQSYHEPMRTQ